MGALETLSSMASLLRTLTRDAALTQHRDIIRAHASGLDQAFFEAMSQLVRDQHVRGDLMMAWRCLVIGVIAGVQVLIGGDDDRRDKACWFFDQFPEHRFRTVAVHWGRL